MFEKRENLNPEERVAFLDNEEVVPSPSDPASIRLRLCLQWFPRRSNPVHSPDLDSEHNNLGHIHSLFDFLNSTL